MRKSKMQEHIALLKIENNTKKERDFYKREYKKLMDIYLNLDKLYNEEKTHNTEALNKLKEEKENIINACRKFRKIVKDLRAEVANLKAEIDWRADNLNKMIANSAETEEEWKEMTKKYLDLQQALLTYGESNACLAGKLAVYEKVHSVATNIAVNKEAPVSDEQG